MSGIEVSEADNVDITCAICMADLKGSNYGLTDDPSDIGAKCCVVCIKQLAQIGKVSLIGRNPIKGYTIYDASGTPLQTFVIGDAIGSPIIVQAPDVVIMMPNSNPVINNYIYQGLSQPVVPMDQPIPQPQVQQLYHYQAPQPAIPARSRICGDCNGWMKLNAIIIGIIWIIGMTLFCVSWPASMSTEVRYGMLGLAMGAIVLGIIIHGVLEYREINRRYQARLANVGV
jgi:hypothetical protein